MNAKRMLFTLVLLTIVIHAAASSATDCPPAICNGGFYTNNASGCPYEYGFQVGLCGSGIMLPGVPLLSCHEYEPPLYGCIESYCYKTLNCPSCRLDPPTTDGTRFRSLGLDDCETFNRYFWSLYKLVDVSNTAVRPTWTSEADAENGCPDPTDSSDPCESAGNPVRFLDGKKWQHTTDIVFQIPGFTVEFGRHYSSEHKVNNDIAEEAQAFIGDGWAHSLAFFVQDPGPLQIGTGAELTEFGIRNVLVYTGTGERQVFSVVGDFLMDRESIDYPNQVFTNRELGTTYSKFAPGLALMERGPQYRFRLLFDSNSELMGYRLYDESTGFGYWFEVIEPDARPIVGRLAKITYYGFDYCWVDYSAVQYVDYYFAPTGDFSDPASYKGYRVVLYSSSSGFPRTVTVAGPNYVTTDHTHGSDKVRASYTMSAAGELGRVVEYGYEGGTQITRATYDYTYESRLLTVAEKTTSDGTITSNYEYESGRVIRESVNGSPTYEFVYNLTDSPPNVVINKYTGDKSFQTIVELTVESSEGNGRKLFYYAPASITGDLGCESCDSVVGQGEFQWREANRLATVIDGEGRLETSYTYGPADLTATPEFDLQNKYLRMLTECPADGSDCRRYIYGYDYQDPLTYNCEEDNAIDMESGWGQVTSAQTIGPNGAYPIYSYTYTAEGMKTDQDVVGRSYGSLAGDDLVENANSEKTVYGDTMFPWLVTAKQKLAADGTTVLEYTNYTYYHDTTNGGLPGMLKTVVRHSASTTSNTTTYLNYDPLTGRPQKIIGPNKEVTQQTFDEQGRILTHTVSDSSASSSLTRTYHYTDTGEISDVYLGTDGTAADRVEHYSYDERGRVEYSADAVGNKIRYTYDDLTGDILAVRYELANGTVTKQEAFEYDGAGRIIKRYCTSDNDDCAYLTTYDANGMVAMETDANGNITAYSYDAFGNVANIDWPPPYTSWSFVYDQNDQLSQVAVNDAAGNPTFATTLTHDDFGRLIDVESPDFGRIKHVYNTADQLVDSWVFGVATHFTYDAQGRVTGEAFYSDINETSLLATHTHTFDTNATNYQIGRLAQETISDNVRSFSYQGSYAYEYDGQPASETAMQTLPSLSAHANAVTYTYEAHRLPSTITYPSGATLTYGYSSEDAQQLDTITLAIDDQTVELVTHAEAMPFGPVSRIDYGNEVANAYNYDERYQLMSIEATGGSGNLFTRTFTRDHNGNITAIAHDQAGEAWSASFAYDSLDQLLSVSGSTVLPAQTFVYDAGGAGNRQSVNGVAYLYEDGTNRLLSTNAGSATAGRQYEYDAYGRVVRIVDHDQPNGFSSATFTYNHQGMIATATTVWTSGTTMWEYYYDTHNRRIAKRSSAGDLTYYTYDSRDRLIAETKIVDDAESYREYYWFEDRLVAVADIEAEASTTPSCGSCPKGKGGRLPVADLWLFVLSLGIVVGRVGRREGPGFVARLFLFSLLATVVLGLTVYDNQAHAAGDSERVVNVYWVHGDQLGTPVMLTNTDGNAVWEATFAPFGEAVSVNEDPDGDGTAVTMNIRMPGQYFDAETGLNYNWHRYYDPAVGRYIEPDPVMAEMSIANPYHYSNNNPQDNGDKEGTQVIGECEDAQDLGETLAQFFDGGPHCLPRCDESHPLRYQTCPFARGYGEIDPGDWCLVKIDDNVAGYQNDPEGVATWACVVAHEWCHSEDAGKKDECKAYTGQAACWMWVAGYVPKNISEQVKAECKERKPPVPSCPTPGPRPNRGQ